MEGGSRAVVDDTVLAGSAGSAGSAAESPKVDLCCYLRYLSVLTLPRIYPVSLWPWPGPESAPRRPNRLKGRPKGAKGSPKGPQRLPKGTQREPKEAQGHPKGSQREPKSHRRKSKTPKGSQKDQIYISNSRSTAPADVMLVNVSYCFRAHFHNFVHMLHARLR